MSQTLVRNKPAKAGDKDAPTERAMVVIPETAERSSGETTAKGKIVFLLPVPTGKQFQRPLEH